MAKHSPSSKSDKLVASVRDYEVNSPALEQVEEVSETIPLQLLVPVNLVIRGSVSGKQYTFPGAGSIVYVNYEDLNTLLEKKASPGCCGMSGGYRQSYFQIAQEV